MKNMVLFSLLVGSLTATVVNGQIEFIDYADSSRCHKFMQINANAVYQLLVDGGYLQSKKESLPVPVDADPFASKLGTFGNGTVTTKLLWACNGDFEPRSRWTVGRVDRTFIENGEVICQQQISLMNGNLFQVDDISWPADITI